MRTCSKLPNHPPRTRKRPAAHGGRPRGGWGCSRVRVTVKQQSGGCRVRAEAVKGLACLTRTMRCSTPRPPTFHPCVARRASVVVCHECTSKADFIRVQNRWRNCQTRLLVHNLYLYALAVGTQSLSLSLCTRNSKSCFTTVYKFGRGSKRHDRRYNPSCTRL